jgi:hypothetical protein
MRADPMEAMRFTVEGQLGEMVVFTPEATVWVARRPDASKLRLQVRPAGSVRPVSLPAES